MVNIAGSKKAAGVRKLFKLFGRSFPAAAYPEDNPAARPRRSSRRDRFPSYCCVAPPWVSPTSTSKWTCSERPSLALLPNCPPPASAPSTHRLSVRTLLAKKIFKYTCPIPPNGTVFEEYSVAKIHIGRPEREILVLVYGCYDSPKPSVHGFPVTADPADRSCRYLG
jgi:hypothetical protein